MATSSPMPPGSSVVIREIRRSDRVTFSEVMLGSYGPFEAMLGLGTKGTDEFAGLFKPGIWFMLKLMGALGRAPVRIFVAADGPTVVGTTMVIPWPNSGYILGVGVRASHRRRGLAGRMLARAEALTKQRGRPWSVLDVEEENLPALTLYRAQHYMPVERASWFRSADPGAILAAPRADASVRVIGKSGRLAAAAWCAAHVPDSVTSVLPPDRHRLTHLEALAQFPGSRGEAWAAGASESPTAYLSAWWRSRGMPGLLFFLALDPAVTHDELVRLVQEGTAWLVARGCPTVVAAVPEHSGAAVPVVQELGFTHVLGTLAMARRLGVETAPPSPTSGP